MGLVQGSEERALIGARAEGVALAGAGDELLERGDDLGDGVGVEAALCQGAEGELENVFDVVVAVELPGCSWG